MAGTQTFISSLEDLVIASGQNISRTVSREECSDAVAVTIQAPGTLSETITIETSFNGTTFATLTDAGGDIAGPAAGKSRQYTELLGFNFWRLKASANVGATRTFEVWKQWSA